MLADASFVCYTVKPVLSSRLKRRVSRLSHNAGQKHYRMLQREHSAILSTFIKLPNVVKTFVCLFLSDRFRQVLLYFGCEKTVQDETRNYQSTMARLSWQIYFLAEIHYWIHGKLTIWYLISFYVKRVGFLWRQIFK